MYLVSFGRAKTNLKVEAKDLQNIGVCWDSYHVIDTNSSSTAYVEFLYIVQKNNPQTKFFITIDHIQYNYNIVMLEDCDSNKVIAIATQPFEENGRLDRVQINWYI